MKKICGALVISLMITTNVFAYDDCSDMFQVGFDQEQKKGCDKGWKEGYMQANGSSVPSIGSDNSAEYENWKYDLMNATVKEAGSIR